jgi:hypothetical protein
MLEKYLPKRQKTEQKPNNLSPNLVSTDNFSPVTSYAIKQDSSLLLKVILLILPVLIGIFFLLNFFQTKTIAGLQEDKSGLTLKLELLNKYELEMRKIAAKTEILKKSKSEGTLSADLMKEVITQMPGNISMSSMVLSNKQASLTLVSPSVLNFSRLISNYLNSQKVSEITLKSAELNTEYHTYTVSLDLFFK